jgi:phosphoadenosine phosphosulfate reductase
MSAVTLYARARPGFDERVAHAVAQLQTAATEHAGAIVQATSLGAEDMVLTDLIGLTTCRSLWRRWTPAPCMRRPWR